MADKKGVSQRKIEANRRNARRSTGPKTPQGKRAVRFNAVKHGLLSKEVVIRGGNGREDLNAYTALVRRLHEDCQPAGIREELLVEQSAVDYWRLRRVLRYAIRDGRDPTQSRESQQCALNERVGQGAAGRGDRQ